MNKLNTMIASSIALVLLGAYNVADAMDKDEKEITKKDVYYVSQEEQKKSKKN